MKSKYTTKQISRLIWQELKANKLQATNNTVAGLLIVGLEFLFVWLTKQTIDIATGSSNIFSFRTAIILIVCTLLAQLLLGAYRSWVNAMLSVKASNKMQMDIFSQSLTAPWRKLMEFHSGDIINRIEKDVNVIVSLVTDTLPSFIIVCAQFIGAFIFLYLMDQTLALFVVIIIPFFLLIGKLYIKTMRRISRQVRKTDSLLQAQYQEGITNRVVIKTIPGGTREIKHRVAATQQKLVDLVHLRARYSVTSNLVMNLGFSTAYLFTFIWGTYHLAQGLITYGALIAFVQLVAQIQRPARSLVKFIPDIINTLTSSERILEIKTSGGLPAEPATGQAPDLKPQAADISISFRNVTFSYRPDGRKILDHFSYDFPAGSRTAIMGPTGQGKTTLIRLILGLIEPTEGTVEISNKRPTSFAYVPQGNTLFSGTIRDNLLLANPQATDAQLKEALRMAKADFVSRFKDGLSSQCGEHGVELSEGQAQRLCIARALLVDAPVLLLDEATSALDADTEATVLHNICTTLTHRTIICVTHREKALEYCPRVLRLS
ncbi:MAG: ABC transporter ATP-binding protein [Bacteroidaceae bacterium]|nr:ABC transporter ATP-binding protein [Bacteroidaceae bacterium]